MANIMKTMELGCFDIEQNILGVLTISWFNKKQNIKEDNSFHRPVLILMSDKTCTTIRANIALALCVCVCVCVHVCVCLFVLRVIHLQQFVLLF